MKENTKWVISIISCLVGVFALLIYVISTTNILDLIAVSVAFIAYSVNYFAECSLKRSTKSTIIMLLICIFDILTTTAKLLT